MKTYHLVLYLPGAVSKFACGAPTYVDYGTTNPGKVTCEACAAYLALRPAPLAAPEPVAYVAPEPKVVKVARKAAKPKPQAGLF